MLKNFAENPFLNSKMSNIYFSQFMNSHIQLLTAANTKNQYTAMITALKPKYDAFKAWVDKQDKNITNRKGKTQSVDSIISDFQKFIKKEVLKEVSYKFADTAKEKFTKFFPNGMTEYSKMTKATAEVLFDRIDKACIAHKTELIAGLDAKATAFNTTYLAARGSQLSGKGSVKDASNEGENLRAEAALVMFINLLDQLKIFASKPEEALQLYDSAAININKRKKKDEGKI